MADHSSRNQEKLIQKFTDFFFETQNHYNLIFAAMNMSIIPFNVFRLNECPIIFYVGNEISFVHILPQILIVQDRIKFSV